jgi:hypothetical protein
VQRVVVEGLRELERDVLEVHGFYSSSLTLLADG